MNVRNPVTNDRLSFVVGDSELARRIRSHAWEGTALGAPETWPESLKTLVTVMLSANQQMYVVWGPRRLLLYNDRYIEVLQGHHPNALGRNFLEVWSEIADDLTPLVENAYAGIPTYADDIELILERRGYREKTHFAYSYTPIVNATGGVDGFFCPCIETTDQVNAAVVISESEGRQAFLLQFSDAIRAEKTPDALADCALRLVAEKLRLDRCYLVTFDHRGDRADFPHQYARGDLAPLPGGVLLSDFPASVRKVFDQTLAVDDADTDTLLGEEDRQSLATIGQRAFVATSLRRGRRDPDWAMVAVSATPRHWTPADILLVEEVAERTWTALQRIRAETALRDSEQRFRALVTAGGNTIYRMRADWRRMFQLDSNSLVETDAPIDDWIDKYIPAEDRARVRDAVEEAIRTKSLYQVEHRVLLPDDSIGWVLSRAVPLLGPNDEIVEWFGVASDVTERREVVEKLDASERRLQLLVAELQHRVRNILTVVRSVFGRTVEPGGDLDDISDHFKGRLDALARTQVVMTASIGGMVDLENMIRDELLSVGAKDGPHLTISGPDVMLPAKVAESLGLAIHELTTNAIKYGALRTSGPTLDIHWHVKTGYGEPPILELTWREQGVPAVELKPSRYGFGSELIEEALPYRLGAETRLQFMGGGVCCTISLPLPDPGSAAANERME